jgi:hypothetical protein
MQSALRDLTPTRTTNPGPFLICQRILSRCHEIIFGDTPEPSSSPYRSLASSSNTRTRKTRQPKSLRVNAHAAPAFIGMGVMMASPGMSGLVDLAGGWAVRQGRRPLDDDEGRSRVEVDKAGGSDGRVLAPTSPPVGKPDGEGDDSGEEDRYGTLQDNGTPSTGGLLSPPHTSRPSATSPNLYSPPGGSTISRSTTPQPKGTDPFGQLPPSTPPEFGRSDTVSPRHQPFHSVPEFSHNNGRLVPNDRAPPPEALLASYSLEAQRQLLRSHYCRSEIRFLLLLEDISNRLLVIPKPARVSALRAELTGINHNLPAEVSLLAKSFCHADKIDLYAAVVRCRPLP